METQTTTLKTEEELKAERVQEELAAAADVVRLKAERVQGPVVAEIVITLHGTNTKKAG